MTKAIGLRVYPHVRDELETLRRVLDGASIARYGDGEFKICRGGIIKSQGYHTPEAVQKALGARLREILVDSGSCLVGIPNLNKDALARMTEQKRAFWEQYRECAKWLEPRPYVSAFITRPDSAPWLVSREYFEMVESLWRGRDVTLVRGSGKSLTAEDIDGAGRVTEIVAMRQDAFCEYDALLERIGRPERALLCVGPTATVLAVDLCRRGVHAIDLGHFGMFLKKHRRGEPMWVTNADRKA